MRTRPTVLRRSSASGLPAVAVLLSLVGIAGTCGPLQTIRIASPVEDQLQVTTTPVLVAGRIGPVFDPATVTFEVDGVELTAALGVTAPFADAGGVVMIGGEPVTVSGFSYDPDTIGTPAFAFQLDGLPSGDHAVVVTGAKLVGGAIVARTRAFGLADGFQQALATTSSAALPGGPVLVGTTGYLANQSLGVALAAPAVSLSGGGAVRSGHVEAAEQLISVGGP